MIIGGAQENTLFNCLDLQRDFNDEVLLLTGPAEGPEGDLLSQGRGGELRVQVIDSLRRAIHPQRDWKAFGQLRSALAGFRPDVVHTHSAKGGILGREAAWKLHVPCVVHSVHGAPFHPYQNRFVRAMYRWCEKRAAERCHHMICVADAMTELMVKGGVATRDKFTTVYSGMDVEPLRQAAGNRETMRQRLGFASDDVVVIKIARLFHLKGHADVIAAAAEVVTANPRVRFLWVGDGLLRSELEAEIARRGLQAHFKLVGLVAPDQIPAYLGAADLLVHASYREGLARALPQALIAGMPAISYDIDGAREVVLPGETGSLVPAGDIAGLARQIAILAADREMRERQGRAGATRFTSVFCHHAMTARIRQIYSRVLDESG
jgi:glycosyltransferase involved in cell wall biosynthesis